VLAAVGANETIERVKLFSTIALAACCVLAGCRSVPPPTPLDQLHVAQMHGHDVFAAHCATCHEDRDTGKLHGPGLAGVFKKPYLPSGAPANDERVLNTIMHGRTDMPAMGEQLDDQETQDLLAYLHTL
jgi:mono/diheme cytochrome c family protein